MRLLKGLIAAALTMGAGAAMAEVHLQGAGATFPAPLYGRWVAEYNKAKPDVKIDYQSIGSGGGIKAFTEKTVEFGASDAPMNKKELAAAGGPENIVEIPSTAGAVVPAYNVPGVNQDIKFTGEIIAEIYMGKINQWNDAKLAAINPGVNLPATAITPVWRTDGSGTTFVFTNYLATQSEDFKSTIGTGKQVKWPGGQGGQGNEGVAASVRGIAGAIGYIEANFADEAKIKYGPVKNKDGKFVKATAAAISKSGEGAVDAMKGSLLTADIWNQPGDESYPISAFTYLLLYKDLKNVKNADQAQALVDFLWWASHDGQKISTEMGYAPIAPAVQKKIEEAIKSLSFGGKPIQPMAAR